MCEASFPNAAASDPCPALLASIQLQVLEASPLSDDNYSDVALLFGRVKVSFLVNTNCKIARELSPAELESLFDYKYYYF